MIYSGLWTSRTLVSPKVGGYLSQPQAMGSASVCMSNSPLGPSHGPTDDLPQASANSHCLFFNFPHFVVPPATGWPPTPSLVLAQQSDCGIDSALPFWRAPMTGRKLTRLVTVLFFSHGRCLHLRVFRFAISPITRRLRSKLT